MTAREKRHETREAPIQNVDPGGAFVLPPPHHLPVRRQELFRDAIVVLGLVVF